VSGRIPTTVKANITIFSPIHVCYLDVEEPNSKFNTLSIFEKRMYVLIFETIPKYFCFFKFDKNRKKRFLLSNWLTYEL
jgi:hypothetical protein